MTEEEIQAVRIGEAYPATTVSASFPSGMREFRVENTPDILSIKAFRNGANEWYFSVKGTLEPVTFKKPAVKPPSPPKTFESKEQAEEGLHEYLRAYVGPENLDEPTDGMPPLSVI